jgi:hypothetical protein
MYGLLSESRTMYGIEIWGLEGGCKEIDKIHSIFCKYLECRDKQQTAWLNWNWGGIVEGEKF